jgi:hypothetical protein
MLPAVSKIRDGAIFGVWQTLTDLVNLLTGQDAAQDVTLAGNLTVNGLLTASNFTPYRVPQVYKFPFAYNTPNLHTGAGLYTPTAGEILLDAWVEVDTAWNGTTPLGDILVIGSGGLLAWAGAQYATNLWIDMTYADTGAGASSVGLDVPLHNLSLMGTSTSGIRCVPAKFISTTKLGVKVSTDGLGTTDPGATTGTGTFYVVVATP